MTTIDAKENIITQIAEIRRKGLRPQTILMHYDTWALIANKMSSLFWLEVSIDNKAGFFMGIRIARTTDIEKEEIEVTFK